jgi:hypothetical protein
VLHTFSQTTLERVSSAFDSFEDRDEVTQVLLDSGDLNWGIFD